MIAAVKSLFSFALKLGYVKFSVAAAVRAPKAMDRLAERILPEAKIHQMIALTPEGRDRMLLRCLYATGARVSEMCAVRWQHVQQNGDSGQITLFGKGGKTHAVVLPPSLWMDLGTEHLLLGLLREEKCFASEILHERGVRLLD